MTNQSASLGKGDCDTGCIIALSVLFGIIGLGILVYFLSVLFGRFCRKQKSSQKEEDVCVTSV